MEAQRRTRQPNRHEGKGAAVCFAALALVLVWISLLTPTLENLLWSLGLFVGALLIFTLLLRSNKNAEENARPPRSASASLFIVLTVLFLSVLLAFLFDFVLLDVWTEFVPPTVSRFLEGVLRGVGIGSIIYAVSNHGVSYWLNQEERKEALRSLKIAMAVIISVFLLLFGIYISVEYVLGPIIRFFA